MVIVSQIIEIWLSGSVVFRVKSKGRVSGFCGWVMLGSSRVRGPHLSFLWFDIANRTRVIGRRLVGHNHNWAQTRFHNVYAS